MNELTPRQREILQFLQDFSNDAGYWPSIRDIQSHFRFRSTNAVAGHLRALEAKRAISRIPGQARTFRISDPTPNSAPLPPGTTDVVEIPVYGDIAAGYPDGIEQGTAIGSIQISADFLGRRNRRNRNFALKVRGDSMIGAGIFEGDTVIFECREPVHNEIVAALIDGETTLKRFIHHKGAPPYLKAENPDFPEIYPVNELIVQGVAQAVVRQL